MAKRVISAAALSAIAMFMWGFVYWGPVLNMMLKLTSPLPAATELDILAPMRAGKMPDGMYVHPGALATPDDEKATAEWERKIGEGPIFHLAYTSGGTSPMDPMMFAKGLAHSFVIALLGGVALAMVAPALRGYGSRAAFLSLVSLIAAIWTNLDNLIWRFYPLNYTLGMVTYALVAGLLMAFITAAIVKPQAPAPASK